MQQVMTGAQFRERVVRPDDEINMEEFDKIWMVNSRTRNPKLET